MRILIPEQTHGPAWALHATNHFSAPFQIGCMASPAGQSRAVYKGFCCFGSRTGEMAARTGEKERQQCEHHGIR